MNVRNGWMAMAVVMAAATTGCAAETADDGESIASEVRGDQLFATAKLNVDGYGIAGEPAGDPGCADLFVGTKDPTCNLPFLEGPTTLGYTTHPYVLNNRRTPANADGFESLPGKSIAVKVKPALAGLASTDGQSVTVRIHRIVSEGFSDAALARATRACRDQYFVKGKSGKWMPRIEQLGVKAGGTRLEDGQDIGDDGLLQVDVCGLSVPLYQQGMTLAWSEAQRAYVGELRTPIGKDGETFGPYAHGSYQVDFLPEESVAMPAKRNVHDAPTAFDLQFFHRAESQGPR